MRVIWMRHGEILLPDTVKRYIGQSDYPMTEKGKEKMERSLKKLHQIFPDVSKICCSDLLRCVQSAQIAARIYGMGFYCDPGLREIHMGLWEGASMEEIREKYPKEYERRGKEPEKFSPPGGENFQKLADRVMNAVVSWEKSFGRESLVLAITHAGVIRAMKCREDGNPLNQVFRYHLDYGAYVLTEYPPAD